MDEDDPHNLQRFLDAQHGRYDQAVAELRQGTKRSHWIWYIFPQLTGLGSSSTAERFAIRNSKEAKAYIEHPVLGPRLIEACRAVLSVEGKSAASIMGHPDDLKLRSCVTLFLQVAPEYPEFGHVLEKYYGGEPDQRTLQLLPTQSNT